MVQTARNPNHKDNFTIEGYKDLGWMNSWQHVYFDKDHNVTTDPALVKTFGYLTEDYPEYGKCRDAKHKTREVDNSLF